MVEDDEREASTGAEHISAEVPAFPSPEEGQQQVDIHKPKAVHSWREFFNEIGVIVIGVLIALGAEQAVEGVHHHREAKDLRAALNNELAYDLAVIKEFRKTAPCVYRRLGEVDRWSASVAGRVPVPLADGMLNPPNQLIRTAVWRSAGGSALAVLPLDRRIDYARLYDRIDNLHDLQTGFQGKWDRMIDFDGKKTLAEDEHLQVNHLTRDLRYISKLVAFNSDTMQDQIGHDLDIKTDEALMTENTRALVAERRADFCRPRLTS